MANNYLHEVPLQRNTLNRDFFVRCSRDTEGIKVRVCKSSTSWRKRGGLVSCSRKSFLTRKIHLEETPGECPQGPRPKCGMAHASTNPQKASLTHQPGARSWESVEEVALDGSPEFGVTRRGLGFDVMAMTSALDQPTAADPDSPWTWTPRSRVPKELNMVPATTSLLSSTLLFSVRSSGSQPEATLLPWDTEQRLEMLWVVTTGRSATGI